MNLLVILRMALRSLRRTALRSSLAVLGIIIGVAAVIALLSIGNGAKAKVEAAWRGLSSSYIVFAAAARRDPANPGAMLPPQPGQGFRLEDYFAIKQEFGLHAAVNLQMFAFGPEGPPLIKARGRASETMLTGMDVGEKNIDALTLAQGAFLAATDVESARSFCIITQTLAGNLFSSQDVLGKRVTIGDVPFTISGVLEDWDMSARSNDGRAHQDTRIIIPYTSLLWRLNRNAEQAMLIVVRPQDPAHLLQVQRQLSDFMERRRGKRTAEFVTGNMQQIVRTLEQNTRTLSLLLASIAGISLVVGGIGIMNIMLVSVKERTREIGIRLAIGARDRDVLRQFLIEAVILSVVGGVVGIALGFAAAAIIGRLGELATDVTMSSIAGAFFSSAAIGIFFGWYPARHAARLDPIEALRAE